MSTRRRATLGGWLALGILALPHPSMTATAIGDWGHFLTCRPVIYLSNPDGREFEFRIHAMRWPTPARAFNQYRFDVRVSDPEGRMIIDAPFDIPPEGLPVTVPAGPGGAYKVETGIGGLTYFWIESCLARSVVWTGIPEGSAFHNQWLVTQPSVPRRWWFWVPDGTTNFMIRTQRDIGNTERERPAITVFTPRGQRIAALFGHPYKGERMFPGGQSWRGNLERRIPVEPGNAGRFWAVEIRLGDAHNYAKINMSLEGVPPYLARSPEDWFNPETGLPAPHQLYDEAAYMENVADGTSPFQMWPPSPSLGDPDGVQVRGQARFSLWNPEDRPLRFDIGDYIVRQINPGPMATVTVSGRDGASLFQDRIEIVHHHHGARPPFPLPVTGAAILDVEVSGVERWFAYTYPATPLVLNGQSVGEARRFVIEVGTARNWYFHVPAGTATFDVRFETANPGDCAYIEVNPPDRTQAMMYGARGAVTVEVPPGMDARTWHLRTDIGSAARFVPGERPRHLGILLTLELSGVPGYLAPTWEQWFDPEAPRPANRR